MIKMTMTEMHPAMIAGKLELETFRREISRFGVLEKLTLKKLNVPSGELHKAYELRNSEGSNINIIEYVCFSAYRYIAMMALFEHTMRKSTGKPFNFKKYILVEMNPGNALIPALRYALKTEKDSVTDESIKVIREVMWELALDQLKTERDK